MENVNPWKYVYLANIYEHKYFKIFLIYSYYIITCFSSLGTYF